MPAGPSFLAAQQPFSLPCPAFLLSWINARHYWLCECTSCATDLTKPFASSKMWLLRCCLVIAWAGDNI